MKRETRSLVCGLAVVLALSGTGHLARAAEGKDIVDTAVAAGSFKTLAAAIEAAGLIDALKGKGPFTVFAPTDEAFAKLPEGTVATLLKPENKEQLVGVLTYHVVPGAVGAKKVVTLPGAVTLNGQRVDIKTDGAKVSVDQAQVVQTDIQCSNGVIHVIDSVILPATDNIPTIAAKAGQFGTLLAAAEAAGLVDALSGAGPLTVFAPTDEAFAKLPAGTVASLLKPENREKLAAILKYHVVPGRIYSDAAVAAKTAKTLQGQSLTIRVEGGTARINDAELMTTDIDASNGVIHVIDGVLLPPAKDKLGAAEAKHLIEQTVARGSRMFNAGHHEGCATLYAETARKMIRDGDHMPSTVMATLSTALQHAEQTHCPTQRSWTLRRSLDRAYFAMQSQ